MYILGRVAEDCPGLYSGTMCALLQCSDLQKLNQKCNRILVGVALAGLSIGTQRQIAASQNNRGFPPHDHKPCAFKQLGVRKRSAWIMFMFRMDS
jgi:hypothetical protein